MIYDTILSRTPIDYGWSGDRKYKAVTASGETFLLRFPQPSRAERFQRCFHAMEQAAALGISMCLPIELGESEEGVYALYSWISGGDAEAIVPTLSQQKQYALGLDAGRALRKLHTLPAPDGLPLWEDRFNAKIDRKLAMYESCPLKYDCDQPMLDFIQSHRHLLANRPQCYQHGDYHIGNMMVNSRGELVIIDFDRDDFGDPWEEFNRIVWCAQTSPLFASGMVDGYFDESVPEEFWQLLELYICNNSLSSLPWAIPFGEGEIQVMRAQQAEILGWYENMTRTVPTWYSKPSHYSLQCP